MRLNELLGTEFPIIQGGMANIATGEFAAAVSNAGALGLIGAGGMDAESVRTHIRRCKELTDKPFGVNIMLMNPAAPAPSPKRTQVFRSSISTIRLRTSQPTSRAQGRRAVGRRAWAADIP